MKWCDMSNKSQGLQFWKVVSSKSQRFSLVCDSIGFVPGISCFFQNSFSFENQVSKSAFAFPQSTIRLIIYLEKVLKSFFTVSLQLANELMNLWTNETFLREAKPERSFCKILKRVLMWECRFCCCFRWNPENTVFVSVFVMAKG